MRDPDPASGGKAGGWRSGLASLTRPDLLVRTPDGVRQQLWYLPGMVTAGGFLERDLWRSRMNTEDVMTGRQKWRRAVQR